MSLCIIGIGTATPRHAIEQEYAAQIASSLYPGSDDLRAVLPALYRQTGIRQRGSVLLDRPGQPGNGDPQSFFRPVATTQEHGPTTAERMAVYERDAAKLATTAALRALETAGIGSKQVTHLVSVSCSGFGAPGVDIELVEQLALPRQTERTHVGFMGCHGALNGLRVANAYLKADPRAVVLLCAVELCSVHHQYTWRKDQLVANALFADGAGAVVAVGGCDNSENAAVRLVASGTMLVPGTRDAMAWHIRDHGFEMSLSPEVPSIIESQLSDWLASWLASQGRTIDDIGAWAIHPGGPRILQACGKALDLPDDALAPSFEVLAQHGNMSSPTVLFILEELERRYAPLPWVALAFGPGLTIEAALFE